MSGEGRPPSPFPLPNDSVPYRTSTASSRRHCFHPEIIRYIRELSTALHPPGPQPRAPDGTAFPPDLNHQTSTLLFLPGLNRKLLMAPADLNCQNLCQVVCQRLCQIECQKFCQIECQNLCQIACPNICEIEGQNLSHRDNQNI